MIKNNLKLYRHKLMMNKKEFAEYVDMNYTMYARWENQIGQPSVENLIKIRDKLRENENFSNLLLDDLVELVEEI